MRAVYEKLHKCVQNFAMLRKIAQMLPARSQLPVDITHSTYVFNVCEARVYECFAQIGAQIGQFKKNGIG